ncbi:MotA/TolQ/ExbB proton channel family protein [Sideroxydans sp. CL21]|uniref:MotA/TolQ/ExbB proton channel family protein n=1 Tax=Sideroxydans sp. CL21 TaxID=2600596 RepID=UPI0024BD1E59|nr:MotA/TolQ/ExbB proton channel family protein [Sideroxydans sp. CL21]
MSFNLIHDLVMYFMIGVLLLATYVIIERLIFFAVTLREGKNVENFVHSHLHDKKLHSQIIDTFQTQTSPQAQAICAVVKATEEQHTNEQLEFIVQSIYVAKKPLVGPRLWILDTIITMSPLLGLLGTILGIIDAFHSLASGNAAADPAAVSRGIGTALYATGFGIFIALYAMMFFNYFNNKVEQINNQMKLISLTVLGAR